MIKMSSSTERSDNTVKDHKQNVPELRYESFEDDWEEKYLKDVCVINPKTEVPEIFNYIDLESVNSGILTYAQKIHKNDAPSRAQRKLDKKDILFATVRPYQQNNYYFNLDGTYVASTGYAQIKAKENSQYLYYFLHTKQFLNEVMKRCTGTSYPAINSNDLKTIKIKIPSNNEQEKIASLFSYLDQKIEFMEKKYNNMRLVKKFFIKLLFDKIKNDKHNVTTLGNISEINMGFTPSTKNLQFWEGNNKWLSIADLNDKYVKDTSKKISDEAIKNKKIIKKNTLVMSFKLTLGKLAILSENMFSNEAICNFKWNRKIDIEYMYYYLNSLRIEKYGTIAAKGVTLNKELLKSIPVIMPNYEKQQEIGLFLKNIDDKLSLINKEIKLNKEFKRSLLSKMFC